MKYSAERWSWEVRRLLSHVRPLYPFTNRPFPPVHSPEGRFASCFPVSKTVKFFDWNIYFRVAWFRAVLGKQGLCNNLFLMIPFSVMCDSRGVVVTEDISIHSESALTHVPSLYGGVLSCKSAVTVLYAHSRRAAAIGEGCEQSLFCFACPQSSWVEVLLLTSCTCLAPSQKRFGPSHYCIVGFSVG